MLIVHFFTLMSGQQCNSDSVHSVQDHLSDLLVEYSLTVICIIFIILKCCVYFSVPVILHHTAPSNCHISHHYEKWNEGGCSV